MKSIKDEMAQGHICPIHPVEHPPPPHPVYIELLTFPVLTPDIGGILCAFQADLDPDM